MGKEGSGAADSNNMKGFYNGLKEVWGSKKKGPVQLKSTDGMETFSDSKRVVARWSKHHEALDNIPQRIIKTSLDEIPTMDEMARAIAGLKDGKAPGGDGIPAEVWKHGGVQQTAPTNHQCLGGGFCTTSMEGCQHCNHLQEM